MRLKIYFTFALLTSIATQAQCWQQISSGYLHTIAIRYDGTLYSWGTNLNGELGLGNIEFAAEPLQVGTDNKWIHVSTNDQTSYGIKSDGTLWGWGYNANGQVGNGTTINQFTPIQIGDDNDWAMVSAGGLHAIALKQNGTIWGWGDNEVNQLGTGAPADQNVPVQIGSATDWEVISAGSFHNLAIKSNGTLWRWGNQGGSTGYTMIQVGSDSDWQKITAGYFYNAAIKTDGTLWTWGLNTSGQLGQGITEASNYTPTMVGAGIWIQVASDWHDMYGITSDGALWQWGQNIHEGIVLYTPTQIGSASNWKAITAGQWFVFASQNDDSLWGWGRNDFHQLGTTAIPWDVFTFEPSLITQCATAGTENFNIGSILLYPNPASHTINILNIDGAEIYDVSIFDVSGKKLISQQHLTSINVQHLASGIYILEIKTGNYNFIKKFIKN